MRYRGYDIQSIAGGYWGVFKAGSRVHTAKSDREARAWVDARASKAAY